MNNICKICEQEFSTGHPWSEHGIKLADYFHKFYPRYSKLTNKLITFKNPEQYLIADFENLQEMKTWLKSAGEEGKEYVLDLLIKRKVKKNWIYAPGQALLRLSNLPSILYYEKEFNQSYSEICKKLGFKIKYKNKLSEIDWNDSIEIIQDTREQKPWVWPEHIKINIAKLNFGDYSLQSDTNLSLERKSLSDFCGSITSGNKRFRKELGRVKKNKGYLIIIVESSFSDFRSLEYLPQMKHSKNTFDHVSKMTRDLYEDFECFQIVFCSGRKHAVHVAEFILKIGKKIKNIDLQYLIDSKII